jgi:hypothetical protein
VTHRLDPLLRPRSVAVVGASARPDSLGEWSLKNLLLGGMRGNPAADIDAFCDLAARFSTMVDTLRDVLAEIDVNPIIVHESGCTIVDGLVVARKQT